MSLEPFTTLMTARHSRILRDPERAQQILLRRYLRASKGSAAAKALDISGNESFAEFLALPPRTYSFFAPLVERALDGDRFAFGREAIVALGETSGSLGKPKLIPHTTHRLECVGRFAKRLLLFQVHDGDHYIPMRTKWLGVGASTNVRVEHGIRIGFISGLHVPDRSENPPWIPAPYARGSRNLRLGRTNSAQRRRGMEPTCRYNPGSARVHGALLEAASVRANGRPLKEVWPLLGRVYYSGTSIAPYRDQMERTLGRRLRVQALYTATEGSFGAELDPMFPGEIHLMVDLAVFAFRDVEEPGSRLLAAWEVSRGHRYEVFVTTLGGLIQYQIGDVLEVTRDSSASGARRWPHRRGDQHRDGEAVTQAGTRRSRAGCSLVRLHRDRFIVLKDPLHPRRHLWIVEASVPISDADAAALIDDALASINPSYAALRQGDTLLHRPRVVVCEPGCFDAYIAAGFATRGQFKFRHLFPDAQTLAGTAGLEAFATILARHDQSA